MGRSAGLNLNVDRVGIAYSDGRTLGDPSSPVQLSCSIVGDRPVPARAMPEVVARIGVDLDPVDVTDADDARWLRACLWPDQPASGLEAEMALAATAPPLLVAGPPAGVAGLGGAPHGGRRDAPGPYVADARPGGEHDQPVAAYEQVAALRLPVEVLPPAAADREHA